MRFHTALEGCFTGTNLGLLGLAAYWQASGVAQLVGCALAAPPGFPAGGLADHGSTPLSGSQAAAPDHETSARSILDRNPFDSVTPRPLDAPPAAMSSDATACDDVKPLIVVAADEPLWSIAAISTTNLRQAKLVRVGDDVGGGRRVELLKGVHIVPEQEGGAVVGIRLSGIRPDTVLGALGLENGDRVQTINGLDLRSPERALEAYARLRTADHLVMQVNRRGREESIDFNIK
jgi:hypothetical protein